MGTGKQSAVACGRRAEALACAYLQARGYRLVEQNFRCPRGEIDCIAYQDETLCFVEVRARSTLRFGTPLESIGRLKMQRLSAAARTYLATLRGGWPPMRFDALGILLRQPPTYTLVQGAFEAW